PGNAAANKQGNSIEQPHESLRPRHRRAGEIHSDPGVPIIVIVGNSGRIITLIGGKTDSCQVNVSDPGVPIIVIVGNSGRIITLIGGKTDSCQVNGLNQYTGIAGQTVKHDANGNMTSEGGVSYSYDNENRLTRVVSPSHTADLEYDPKGRLVKYTVQGVATHLVYDGDNLILEIKQGAVTHRYVHTGNMGTPAVSYTGNTVGAGNRQFLHNNHQGSVIAATDNSGNASYINTYDAYGVPG